MVDDIDWWRLLDALLTEHDPTPQGERLAVLDFCVIYRRIERDQP